ncbi:MAG TPA: hypothetical protein VFM23_07575 [Gemmatimonadales bacterium]|nr:hypothetical protein [Gemmatimonadales bacterium]
MPANKDFKRLVRARMLRTGESYTSARSKLVRKPAAKVDYAALAGMSDAAIKAKTGCTWERWTHALDSVGAHAWPHRKIADYVHKTWKVPDWWTQTVTVGYERIKGIRAIGQRRDGSYEASKSKTFPVSLARLYRSWSDARLRARWLPDALTVRSATPQKYMRIVWSDDTLIQLVFSKKGDAKSAVAVQHTKLPDRAAVTKMKAFWEARLNALAEAL